MNKDLDIFKKFVSRKYKKGQVVLFQGEVPRFGYIVKEGIIKEYDISKQGDEQITWLINVSEVFPFPWLIGIIQTVPLYYEAASDCELYVLSKEDYLSLIKNNNEFMQNELKKQAAKENAQSKRLSALLNSKAENKLINTFHYLVDSYGIKSGNNFITIDLILTHQDIASLTGLTRETVTKELIKLKTALVIKQQSKRSKYEIDLLKLNNLLSTPLSNLYFSK